MTLLSIVTAVKNDHDGLLATIQSVMNQTPGPFEFVVQDGGSEDQTATLEERFHGWIDVFTSAPSGGRWDAMNQSVAAASGEYVLFLEPGSRFQETDTVAKLCAVLKYSGADFVGAGVASGTPADGAPPSASEPIIDSDLQRIAIRRTVLAEQPFDVSLPHSADLDFLARRRVEGCRFQYVSEPRVRTRRREFGTELRAYFAERQRVLRDRYSDLRRESAVLQAEALELFAGLVTPAVLSTLCTRFELPGAVEELKRLADRFQDQGMVSGKHLPCFARKANPLVVMRSHQRGRS